MAHESDDGRLAALFATRWRCRSGFRGLLCRGWRIRSEANPDFFRKLVSHQFISGRKQPLQLAFRQHIEAFKRYPMVTSDVRCGYDAFLFGQFGELLRCTLERHTVVGGRLQREHAEHLVADAHQQIIFPLDPFGNVR